MSHPPPEIANVPRHPGHELGADAYYHERSDPHRKGSKLQEIVLGGQDGLVNVLGVILGVAAATQETMTILAAGLAAAFAESISMGAVAFTSARAGHAHYEAERRREHRHLDVVPHLERAEVRELYARKGFEGELLDRIVATITADRDVWVAVMLAEEHRLVPAEPGSALRSAFVVFWAALAGSLIPLLPFFWAPVTSAMWVSTMLSAVSLFGTGVYKAWTTVGHPLASGLEMLAIGLASAAAGYGVGLLFQTQLAG